MGVIRIKNGADMSDQEIENELEDMLDSQITDILNGIDKPAEFYDRKHLLKTTEDYDGSDRKEWNEKIGLGVGDDTEDGFCNDDREDLQKE